MTSHSEGLSPRDLERLRRLVYQQSGITLSAEKKLMLEGRLRRRMAQLSIGSYRQYCEYVFDGGGHEARNWCRCSTWSPPTRPTSSGSRNISTT